MIPSNETEARAKDPATPVHELLALAPLHPALVHENPAMKTWATGGQLAASNPNETDLPASVTALPEAALRAFLSLETPAEWVFESARIASEELQLEALKHRSCNSPLRTNTQNLLVEDPSTPEWTLRKIYENNRERWRSNGNATLFRIARHPHTPVDVLQALLAIKAPALLRAFAIYLRVGVAQNPSLTTAMQLALLEDPSKEVRAALSENPNLCSEAIERMPDALGSEYERIIGERKLAANQTPETLAITGTEEQRAFVAATINCTPALLQTLAKDSSPRVRREVAKNPRTDEAIIEQLVEDEDEETRRAACAHIHCTPTVLARLAQSTQEGARRAAAEHPACPEEALTQLANDASELVRTAVAASARTPTATLKNMAKDSSVMVRMTLAENARTPLSALRVLAKDPDSDVSELAKERCE